MEVVVGFRWCICISGCFWWYVKMLTFLKKVHRNVIWAHFSFSRFGVANAAADVKQLSIRKAPGSISFARDRAEWDLPSEFWEWWGPSSFLTSLTDKQSVEREPAMCMQLVDLTLFEGLKPHDQKIIGKKTLGHSPRCSPLSIPVDHHLEKKAESEWKHAAPCMFIYWTFTVF